MLYNPYCQVEIPEVKGERKMTRTYWIKHNTIDGVKFDKVVYTSPEDRLSWHKVEALNKWKRLNIGYGRLTIMNVYTKQEMKANGYI